MAQQGREVPSSINLEEINRTSLYLPQQVPHCESNIEPFLQEVYPEDIERLNTTQETYMEHDIMLI